MQASQLRLQLRGHARMTFPSELAGTVHTVQETKREKDLLFFSTCIAIWLPNLFLPSTIFYSTFFVVFKSLSAVCLFVTPWTAARQAFLSFTTSLSLLKIMSTESVMHPTIASSVSPFSSRPQSFPASGSFPMIWLFSSGGESIGASASVSVLPMDIQG